MKLRFTSLPGNRNPLVSDGFEAGETIPITVTYDSRGHPVVTSATIAEGAGSPSNYTRAVGLSAAQQRELDSVGAPRCSFTATGCWRSFPDQSAIYAIEEGAGVGGPSAPGALKINPADIITQALKASAPSGPANTAKLVAAVKTVEKMPVTTYYMDLTIKLAALAGAEPADLSVRGPAARGRAELQRFDRKEPHGGRDHRALRRSKRHGRDGERDPAAGAHVVLERATKPGGPFHPVPNHSAIMSPANRRNPYRDRSFMASYGQSSIRGRQPRPTRQPLHPRRRPAAREARRPRRGSARLRGAGQPARGRSLRAEHGVLWAARCR